jgi:hypothetical protein
VALADLTGSDDDEEYHLDLLLPSPDGGPEEAYARAMLLEELQAALEDLPAPSVKCSSPMNSTA